MLRRMLQTAIPPQRATTQAALYRRHPEMAATVVETRKVPTTLDAPVGKEAEEPTPVRPTPPPAVAPAFALCGLTKVHGKGDRRVEVFRAVDFEAPARSGMFGIKGESGAGKTTLLNMLAGLDVPTSGYLRVCGVRLPRDVRKLAEHRRRVGTVLQSKNLIDHLTARGNIAVPLALHGMPWRLAQAKAEHWLGVLGLRECSERRPAQLSGGQQQRVAIARALAADARLIVADEPTSNLDAQNARQVLLTLRIAARTFRTTVVLVSHDANALAFCDHVLCCADGTLTRTPATSHPAAGAGREPTASDESATHDDAFSAR